MSSDRTRTWDLAALRALGPVHLIGVGGAGMSAVAALLAAEGLAVTGSDARDTAALDSLRSLGVTVHVGHDAGHVSGAGSVVVSTAVRATNPELRRATELGLPVLHRSQALAALMAGHRAVAVAGAHGKTTTSAMVAVTLAHAGLDPSYAIGGTVLAGPTAAPAASATASAQPARAPVLGGAHRGTGDVFVAEADESDGSFLAYAPHIAIVTNVEPDHLDHYGTRAAFEQAFTRFAGRIAPGGWLVACADDPGARALADRARAAGTQVRTYGTAADADVRVGPWVTSAGSQGGSTTLWEPGGAPGDDPGRTAVELRLTAPGAHNALNAAAAWTAARLLGVDPRTAADGLGTFVGTGRRFEHRGTAGGVRVVDSYDHHPTEVAALLRAARQVAGDGRVLVLFQPHLYSRTKTFAAEFAAALGLADEVVVTDVYGAREDPVPGVTGALITARMHGTPGRFVADGRDAARALAAVARAGDLLLTVGAGDVTELAPQILTLLGSTDLLGSKELPGGDKPPSGSAGEPE